MSKPTDETLRDWIKYCSLSENPDYEMVIVAAKELLELRERTRWIPVTEKLPNEETVVLANSMYGVLLAIVVYGKWFGDKGEISGITHWMDIPK